MDAMITERMARAREKDEQSLRLFNQLRERRGSNVRIRSHHRGSFTLIIISMARLRVHIPRMFPARGCRHLPRLPRQVCLP